MNHSQIDNYYELDGIPAMTSPQVHEYLEELGQAWTGQGTAMELGCWLGASSVALLRGLVRAGYDCPYWAFDAWVVTKDQQPKAAIQGVRLNLGQDVRPLFWMNVESVYKDVAVCKGSLPGTLSMYNGRPIEICIFDAPKAEPTFSACIKILSPYWIPGVTILGLLDYNFYRRHSGVKREKFRAPVAFMERYGGYFEIEKQWVDECVVFFRYIKELAFY